MFVALFSLWLGASAPPSLAYERYVVPEPLTQQARALGQEVRLWSQGQRRRVELDFRLVRAAKRMCPVLSKQGELPPQDALETAVWHEGVTDAELTAIALVGPSHEHPKLLREQLRAEPTEIEPTHFGLAECPIESKGSDPKNADARAKTLVLMSRRLVQLAPVASWRAPDAPLHLLGQLTTKHIEKVLLAVIASDGSVQAPRPLDLKGGAFVTDVALGRQGGTARVQLLVERGNGPEVAAEFPVEVGHPQHRTNPAGGLRAHHTNQSASHLAALILGLRKSHQLGLVEPLMPLYEVAREHCEDMQRQRYFAHISQTTGSVVERLAKHHQGYLHVVENLAEARDVEDMFMGWVKSPAHLGNLLDKKVDHFGLALCSDPRGLTPTKAVLVMVQLKAPGPREAVFPRQEKSDGPLDPAPH